MRLVKEHAEKHEFQNIFTHMFDTTLKDQNAYKDLSFFLVLIYQNSKYNLRKSLNKLAKALFKWNSFCF